jgi:hypothetical protein
LWRWQAQRKAVEKKLEADTETAALNDFSQAFLTPFNHLIWRKRHSYTTAPLERLPKPWMGTVNV